MILPADQTGYIARGDRTTIRVPVDPRLTSRPLRAAGRNSSKPFRPALGERLPVAKRVTREGGKEGWETTCYVTIRHVTREPLGTLTDDQAKAEGYPTARDFEQAWVRIHDREWLDRQIQYLIDQDIPTSEAEETRDAWADVRYRDRWAIRPVWVMLVEVEHDLPRHLEPAGAAKSEFGYVISSTDPITAGHVMDSRLAPTWKKHADARHAKAQTEKARRKRARELEARVRFLALSDHPAADQIEALLNEASDQEAA